MTKRLPDLEAWAIFARVAELGSFAGAARELGLSDPTVSKAIARLEARLGVALIARTSRRFALTEAGSEAVTRAARILREGEAAEAETGEQARVPRGRVRMSAPLSFGIFYLGAVLPAFLEAYPQVTLDLALSDRQVDLVAGGFDLALRISTLEDSSLRSRRLCAVRLLLVGAPSYFDAHGMPDRPADLEDHVALGYSGGVARSAWRFSHSRLGEESVEPPIRLRADNADLLMPVLLAGQGLAIQPEFLVWRQLQEGSLQVAMPEWTISALSLHLLTPPSPLRPLRVQVLIDHLVRELARAAWTTSSQA